MDGKVYSATHHAAKLNFADFNKILSSLSISLVIRRGCRKPRRLVLISKFFLLFLVTCLVSCSNAPKNQTSDQVLADRLGNAQLKDLVLGNGAVFRELKFAGSLQPNFILECIPVNKITNKYNPPSLILGAKKCIQNGDYQKAWALFSAANAFAYYDLKRLADRSTQGALSVTVINAFSDISQDKLDQAQRVSEEMRSDPEQVKIFCNELTRIGNPTYEPKWAILHGIGAYQEPRNGEYLINVKGTDIWAEALKTRCTPMLRK